MCRIDAGASHVHVNMSSYPLNIPHDGIRFDPATLDHDLRQTGTLS